MELETCTEEDTTSAEDVSDRTAGAEPRADSGPGGGGSFNIGAAEEYIILFRASLLWNGQMLPGNRKAAAVDS